MLLHKFAKIYHYNTCNSDKSYLYKHFYLNPLKLLFSSYILLNFIQSTLFIVKPLSKSPRCTIHLFYIFSALSDNSAPNWSFVTLAWFYLKTILVCDKIWKIDLNVKYILHILSIYMYMIYICSQIRAFNAFEKDYAFSQLYQIIIIIMI